MAERAAAEESRYCKRDESEHEPAASQFGEAPAAFETLIVADFQFAVDRVGATQHRRRLHVLVEYHHAFGHLGGTRRVLLRDGYQVGVAPGARPVGLAGERGARILETRACHAARQQSWRTAVSPQASWSSLARTGFRWKTGKFSLRQT